MKWFVYKLPPIDYQWDFQPSVEEVRRQLQAAANEPGPGPSEHDFLHSWEGALSAASRAGWEGDFKNDPAVFWIPDDQGFSFGFAIKQYNNGTTFVISPIALRHLDEQV